MYKSYAKTKHFNNNDEYENNFHCLKNAINSDIMKQTFLHVKIYWL